MINKIRGFRLNRKQKKIDKLYEEEGLTDRVLDMQLEVNEKRFKHDISDPNQKVYQEYVQ